MSRWFIVAGLLALAAPTAAQPDSAPPAGQPVGTPPAQTPALPAGVPLSLEESLRAAERASETISVARADVDRARAQVGIARSSYYPLQYLLLNLALFTRQHRADIALQEDQPQA